jgi:outer membrane lipoprotein-sorting protein
MKKIVAAIALLIAFNASAQDMTAGQVIDTYLEKVGGKEKISAIKDITISSTSDTPRGVSETEIKYKAPHKYMMSVYGMELFKTMNNGEKVVRKSSFGGGGGERPEKTGKEAQIEGMMMSPFPEMYYAEAGLTSNMVGVDKVEDKEAYKIELTAADGRKSFVWFDKASFLKIKTSMTMKSPRGGGEVEQVTLFEDYTKFKGTEVLLPKVRKQTTQMGEIVSEVNSVKVNKGIEDKVFEAQ